jgi:hypothetical protein
MSAMGMVCAGFQSCEADKENAPEPNNSYTVSVDFGNGEETWSATYANWEDYTNEYNEVNLHFEAEDQFPLVIGSVIPAGNTDFPTSWDDNEYLFFEYYSTDWEKIGSALMDYERGIPYGDWQVDSGTVTITSLTDTHISGTADLVMYDLVEYAIEMNDYPTLKPLKVTFSNVPIDGAMQNRAVTRSIETPDNSFSFSGGREIQGLRR